MLQKIICFALFFLLSFSFSYTQVVNITEAEDLTVAREGIWIDKEFEFASGKKIVASNTPSSKISFKFSGKSISITFFRSEYSGIADIILDGKLVKSIDLYEYNPEKYAKAEQLRPKEFLISNNLEDKEHHLQIVVSENKNSESKERYVYVDKIKSGSFPFATISLSLFSFYGKYPVSNANVEISPHKKDKFLLQPDFSGNVTLSGLSPGKYTLNITSTGYENKSISLSVSKGDFIHKKIKLKELCYSKPITLIQKPLSTQPAIVKRGEILKIYCLSSKNLKNWKVNLKLFENTYPLKIVKNEFDKNKKLQIIQCKIPENLPVELYDLEVSNNKEKDKRLRAVKVISEYKDKFYFAHLTDIHIGGPYPKASETFEKTIEELNLTNPEFIILTGDLTDNGKLEEYMELLRITNNSRIPTYFLPGNHDVEAHKDIEQLYRWKKYIGDNYYSFRYGNYNFLLLDNSSCKEGSMDTFATSDFPEEQLIFAEKTLEENKDAKLQFIAYHVPTRENISYIHKLADKYKVKLVLYGHGHEDRVDVSGTTPTNYVETTSLAMEKRYRIVKVEGDNVSFNYGDSDRLSMPAGRTKISFSNPNDGTSPQNTATIKNPMRERYDVIVKFIMPKGNYHIDNGNLLQVVEGKKHSIWYVSATVESKSDKKISIYAK